MLIDWENAADLTSRAKLSELANRTVSFMLLNTLVKFSDSHDFEGNTDVRCNISSNGGN